MAQQLVAIGTVANDGTGDALRVAFDKLNDNDAELYAAVALKLNASAVGTAAAANTGTSAGNVPILDGSGLLATSILPALAITKVNVVASQAAMLALTAQEGDVAVRSDENKSYILSTNSPGTLADWKELLTPTDAVLSVAGQTGAITASALRTALSLVVGTDVQAYDADLAAIAGLTSAADKLPYFSGSGAASLANFTAAGRALVDDADAAAQRVTLGLVIGTNVRDASDIDLAADVTGTLPVANGGTGDTGTAWTSYTPTIGAGSGTITTPGTTSGAYKQIGKTVHFRFRTAITTNGTAAGTVNVSLPVEPLASTEMSIPCRTVNSAFNCNGRINTDLGDSLMHIYRFDAAYPGGDGTIIVGGGTYEAA